MSLIQKALAAVGLQRKSTKITWADGRNHGTPGIAGEFVMRMFSVLVHLDLLIWTISSP